MKKVIKILGIVLGIILFAGIIFAAYIKFSPMPTYEVKAPNLKVEMDSLSIAHGEKIVSLSCIMCHQGKDGKLSGQILEHEEGLGQICAPNITNNPTYGIANYSPGELVLLLRTGIKKNGEYAPPWMSKFPLMSDEDIEDIVAFLKSDRPLVQPSDNKVPPSKPNFLATALIKMKAFGPLDFPTEKIVAPNPNDEVAYGKYLATAVYDCFSCHSPSFMEVDVLVPENTPGYFSGGNPMKNKQGEPISSRNLTMHPETGIGKWTKEQFIRNVKYGIRPDKGPSNRDPMLPFSTLSDEEVGAIWEYLKTIPIIENEVLRNI